MGDLWTGFLGRRPPYELDQERTLQIDEFESPTPPKIGGAKTERVS